MELETARLRLRRWRPEDRPLLYAINAEPEVERFLTPLTREASDALLDRVEAHFARYGWGYWALVEKRSAALIGLCGIMHAGFDEFFTPAVEASWRLTTSAQGKGFAREAAERVFDHAVGPLGLDRLVAFTAAINAPSRGLMLRLGMTKLGDFDNPNVPPDHPLRLHMVYELRAENWRKSRQAGS